MPNYVGYCKHATSQFCTQRHSIARSATSGAQTRKTSRLSVEFGRHVARHLRALAQASLPLVIDGLEIVNHSSGDEHTSDTPSSYNEDRPQIPESRMAGRSFENYRSYLAEPTDYHERSSIPSIVNNFLYYPESETSTLQKRNFRFRTQVSARVVRTAAALRELPPQPPLQPPENTPDPSTNNIGSGAKERNES